MSLIRSYFVRTAVAGLLGVAIHSGIAYAQNGTWTPPSSGYIFDSINRSIRPIAGLIGSAALGPPVASAIDWLSVAPNQTSALAESGGSLVSIPNLSAAGTSLALNNIPMAQQAFWAADASQAVVLADGAKLFWLTNLNSSPVPLSSWNLDSYSRGGSTNRDAAQTRPPGQQAVWSLLAADSSANQVLLALQTGETWQIWLASSTVPPVEIPFSGLPRAAAFASGNGSVFVADAAGHRIVQIQSLQTTPVLTTLVSSEVYVKDPTSMALSSDGSRLFIGDRSDNVIRVFNAGGGSAGAVAPLAELPTAAAPLSLTAFVPGQFVMNAAVNTAQAASQPVFILDTAVPATVSFVPRGK
jgi:hypothetical protein